MMHNQRERLWETRLLLIDELIKQHGIKREYDRLLCSHLRYNTVVMRNRRERIQIAIDCLEIRLKRINHRLSISRQPMPRTTHPYGVNE